MSPVRLFDCSPRVISRKVHRFLRNRHSATPRLWYAAVMIILEVTQFESWIICTKIELGLFISPWLVFFYSHQIFSKLQTHAVWLPGLIKWDSRGQSCAWPDNQFKLVNDSEGSYAAKCFLKQLIIRNSNNRMQTKALERKWRNNKAYP